jgi:hypothetical protein
MAPGACFRFSFLVLVLAFEFSVFTPSYAQSTCINSGTPDSSNCSCPVGWGGSDCSSPACGGNIFEGSGRNLSPSKNITKDSCACENGWGGFGCNVCQTASACQAGFSGVKGSSGASDPTSQIGGTSGLSNSTLVCNQTPHVWASSQMSCDVVVCAFLSLVNTANFFQYIFPFHLL